MNSDNFSRVCMLLFKVACFSPGAIDNPFLFNSGIVATKEQCDEVTSSLWVILSMYILYNEKKLYNDSLHW